LSGEQLRVLAEEQAALRRVATLVARGAPPEELFAAVAEEVGRLLGTGLAGMARYGSDDTVTVVATWVAEGEYGGAHPLVPGPWPLEGGDLASMISRTGRSVRIDDYRSVPGRIAAFVRDELGITASVGGPIVVEGRLWGALFVHSRKTHQPFPRDTESRLTGFTELIATAIANAESRAGLARLAEEQAALRRVATLVARGAPPEEVFAAVAEEVGRLLRADFTFIGRSDPDGTIANVGGWNRTGDPVEVGTRYSLGGQNVTTLVLETGRPARMDSYANASGAAAAAARTWGAHSAAGAPITVEGRLWGLMTVASTGEEPLPVGTEERLAAFTELVATAIANAQARMELRGFAEEQAALRRVATLVARAAPPEEVFAAVTAEVGRVLSTDVAGMSRYDSDGATTVVGVWTSTGAALPVPGSTRLSPGGRNVTTLVFETGRPARIDDYADASGPAADLAREEGLRASVGVPITVEGRLWGVVMVSSRRAPLRADTQARLAGFTELVGTALANTEAQAALTASRARIVATADQTRRRIERDLHDGAQQRLVSLVLQLRAAQAAVAPELARDLDHLAAGLHDALEELREFARGIHPAILSEGGLGPALRTLARRCPVPVDLQVHVEGRLPERVEVTAYYVVAEALTNVAKHAGASVVQVEVVAEDGLLRLGVRDDGVGGADPARGSGLVGLKDRVEATGGTLRVDSRAGQGTRLLVELPIDAGQPPDST
jgi:signal transduction histidine kinase